ncbi:hypothetical protein QR680_015681 [Steinernema hermaphroditum]|uniref:Uncharacterized protein n=1 Tax=Steinernema hermaphroditum TaxID=289476 RepID=A0AA39HAT9_9BILA|nr:hypothetical protein QR680_015681 [Steinernema hermaphroditum]
MEFVYFSYAYAIKMEINKSPISGECFVLGCSRPFAQERCIVNIYFALPVANFFAGAVFAVLLYCKQKITKLDASKMNKVTRFLFFARAFSEIVPFTIDIVVNVSTGISVGYYIGPFGMIGTSLEQFLFVVVYKIVFRAKSVNVPRMR